MKWHQFKSLVLVGTLLWLCGPAAGSGPIWTWIKGGSSHDHLLGIYGIQGIAAPGNQAGARQNAATWTDKAGRLWLFGGIGYSTSNLSNPLNDLWRYDPATNTWTWIKGSNQANHPGVYGTKGVAAPANMPCARYGAATWIDASDRLWLFGGETLDPSKNEAFGNLNDIWCFDPSTGNWTWVEGGQGINQWSDGVPTGRYGCATWKDKAGRFWLFGGRAHLDNYFPGTDFNDLWCFDPVRRAWVFVDGSYSRTSIFGTQGSMDEFSWPGARYMASTLTDQNGRLWLLGGHGKDESGHFGYFNDLWRYDPASGKWAWYKGSKVINSKGICGTQGVANPNNAPGGRAQAAVWLDSSGKFNLFGGTGYDAHGFLDQLDDLWRYDPATGNWTWIKGGNPSAGWVVDGTQGGAASENNPCSRDGMAKWTDGAGRLWIFSGSGNDTLGIYGGLNDLWRFDLTTLQWIRIKGSSQTHQAGVYGTQGVGAATNKPGGRHLASNWIDQYGRLWIFGGWGIDGLKGSWALLNDLWRFDPASGNWTWIKGSQKYDQQGIYGTQGIASASNTPGARYGTARWMDASGRLYLYGGVGNDSNDDWGYLGDLWRFDPQTGDWTWIKGSKVRYPLGVYGTRGIPSSANTPGARGYAAFWTDQSGQFWLFGGKIYDYLISGKESFYNDLWRYDPTTDRWTWVKGSSDKNQTGTYGTQGLAATANTPGARWGATAWADKSGRLWLFGGVVKCADGNENYPGDLWCFNPASSNWTWIKGNKDANQSDVYGTQGMPAAANNPGARYGATGWTDRAGRLWLFGGYAAPGSNRAYNDLWCFDPASLQWTWVGGSNTYNQAGVYGRQGIGAPANIPGAREGALGWSDKSGNFWLFGGEAYDSLGRWEDYNDLWLLKAPMSAVGRNTWERFE